MDFIERWFGVSPDGGNGMLEMVYVASIVTVVVGLIIRRFVFARPTVARTRNERP